MPYADDIREPPHASSLSANSDEVAAASKVIESFHRRDPFNPDVFPNPALQYHYDILMAHAFGHAPPAYNDTILPDYALIERVRMRYLPQRSGTSIRAYNEVLLADPRTAETRHSAFDASLDETLRRMHREHMLDRVGGIG